MGIKHSLRRIGIYMLAVLLVVSSFIVSASEAFAMTTGSSGSISPQGAYGGWSGGIMHIDKPAFRVGLSRDNGFFNAGNSAGRQAVVDKWANKFPDNNTSILFAPAGEKSKYTNYEIGRYNAGSRRIDRYDDSTSLGRVHFLVNQGSAYNRGKELLAGYSYTGMSSTKMYSTLAKGKWKTLASNISEAQARTTWSYILAPVGSGRYEIDERINETISSTAWKYGHSSVTDAQDEETARGYLGLLMSLWRLTPSSLRGQWETAIEDYLVRKDATATGKPVSIVTDTVTALTFDKEGRQMLLPTVDYYHYYVGISSAYSFHTGTASRMGTSAGDTNKMLLRMAQQEVSANPRVTRLSHSYNRGDVFSHGAIGIAYPRYRLYTTDNKAVWRNFDILTGYMDLLNLGTATGKGKINGFLSTGGWVFPQLKEELEDPESFKPSFYAKPDNKVVDVSNAKIGDKVVLSFKRKNNSTITNSWTNLFNEDKTRNKTINVKLGFTRTISPSVTATPKYSSVDGNYITGVNLSKYDFLDFLKGAKEIQVVDDVSGVPIRQGQKLVFNYKATMTVTYYVGTEKKTLVVKDLENSASFVKGTPPVPDKAEDPTVPPEFVGYTSDSETFAEFKEGTPNNENFDSMTGVPSNKRLYLAVGGSEFIVDVELEYKEDVDSVWRTYRSYFTATDSEFRAGDTAPNKTIGGKSADMHNGGTYTETWSGSIPNKGTSASGSGTATSVAVPDYTAYNADKAKASAYVSQVNSTTHTHTSASDKVTRTKTGWNARITTDSKNPPTNNTQTNYETVTYSCPTKDEPSKTCTRQDPKPVTATPNGAGSYTITVTFDVPRGILDGPDSRHVLPMVEDTWKQRVNFDYMKIIRANVYKIEEGKLTQVDNVFGEGNEELRATIQSGDPKVFHNIAQQNAGGNDVTAQSSQHGRLRYTLEPDQHDVVVWNEGVRSNKSDGMGNNGSGYSPAGGGHNNAWATGILYNNSGYTDKKDVHLSKGGSSTSRTANADTKDIATVEWKKFDERRKSLNKATVISDMLILQTSSGDQSVIYFDKDSETKQSQEQFPDVNATKEEMWDKNTNSAANWNVDKIYVGSYNGKYEQSGYGASNNRKYWGLDRGTNSVVDNTSGGSRLQVATAFDDNGAGVGASRTRPARPSQLYIYGSNAIVPTTPNGMYTVGEAETFYSEVLNWKSLNPYPDFPDVEMRDNLYEGEVQADFANKKGLVFVSPYSKLHNKVNDVVIHTPVSAEDAMIVSLPSSLDQRTEMPAGGADSLIDEQSKNQAENNNANAPATEFNPATKVKEVVETTTRTTKDIKVSENGSSGATGDVTFAYKGSPEEFTAPETGEYTLEVWGGKGGWSRSNEGGNGGYAKGTVTLNKGEKLTIIAGGMGSGSTSSSYWSSTASGGYNGGAKSGRDSDGNDNGNNETGGGGGGFSIIKKGTTSLVVAGGGGGAQYSSSGGTGFIGGGGGGSYGGTGSSSSDTGETGGVKIGGDGGSLATQPDIVNGTGWVSSSAKDVLIQKGANNTNGKARISYNIAPTQTDKESETIVFDPKVTTSEDNYENGDFDGYMGWTWEQLFGSDWGNYLDIQTATTVTTETDKEVSESVEEVGGGSAKEQIVYEPFTYREVGRRTYSGGTISSSFTLPTITKSMKLIVSTMNGNSMNNTSSAPIPSGVLFTTVGGANNMRQLYTADITPSDSGKTISFSGGSSWGYDAFLVGSEYTVTADYSNQTLPKSNAEEVVVVTVGDISPPAGFTSVYTSPSYSMVYYKIFDKSSLTYTKSASSYPHHITLKRTGGSSNEATNFAYTGTPQTFTVPATGTYLLETWGAEGGGVRLSGNSNSGSGGLGGYSKGEITLTKGDVVSVYVGGHGKSSYYGSAEGGWNGGGAGYGSSDTEPGNGGGGASDIRLNGTSLSDRVIVAGGGGGGGEDPSDSYGHGGGLTGTGYPAYDATQSYVANGGSLGFGASTGYGDGGGGGGGYYGGGTLSSSSGGADTQGGGGGSGYISGLVNAVTTPAIRQGHGLASITPLNVQNGQTITTTVTDDITRKITRTTTTLTVKELLVQADLAKFPDRMPDGSWNPVKAGYGVGEPPAPPPSSGPVVTSSGAVLNVGTFIALDREFSVYFPSTGNFSQRPDMFGVGEVTSVRGRGYTNNMNVAQYTHAKRVKFDFNVLFNGQAYSSGSWIDLPLNQDYHDFYAVLGNTEQIGSLVEFESIPINGQPTDFPENDNYDTSTNKDRDENLVAKHGAYKRAYTDVIGRIGNFTVTDTEDFRFSNLFKQPTTEDKWLVDGLVKDVDMATQRAYYGDHVDIRGTALSGTGGRLLNTYGSQTWMTSTPLSLPVNASDNPISSLKQEHLKVGYDILGDISTIGSYPLGAVRALPYYFKLNLDTGSVTPLDVYQKSGDEYNPVNIYGGADGGTLPSNLYPYNLIIDWENEYKRRNYSMNESVITSLVSKYYGEPVIGTVTSVDNSSTETGVSGYKDMTTPTGNFVALGNAQRVVADKHARTFVGGTETYGQDKNPANAFDSMEFMQNVQRWHLKFGLPSSSVFVEAGKTVSKENVDAIKSGTGLVLMAVDIVAVGDLYAIRWNQSKNNTFTATKNGVTRTFNMGGSNLPTPVALYDMDSSALVDVEIKGSH